MIRFVSVLIICLSACLCISVNCLAADPVKELSEALELSELRDKLPEDARIAAGSTAILDTDINGAAERLADLAKGLLSGVLGDALKKAAAIVSAAALCSMLTALFGEGKSTQYVTLAGVMAVTAIAVGDMRSFLGLAGSTMHELDDYSKILLPALTAAASAGGAISAAAVKYSATVLFLQILISLSDSLVIPLICAYAAASVAGAAMGGAGLNGAANLIKWLTVTIMTLVMGAFVIYLTVTGVVASSADAAAARIAKTTVSTMLPVVGGMVSDAASTVISAAAGIRNAVGVFGLFALSAICLCPFLKLGIHYLIFKASAALTAVLTDSAVSKAVSALAASIGMALGLSGACAMMLFISILSVIKVAPV
ncbi:MAG: hypothetical protein IJG63_08600 [Oscillospiraceae bacterium]|nr:hypothetical protein [Oscillospiraceae bacterium]